MQPGSLTVGSKTVRHKVITAVYGYVLGFLETKLSTNKGVLQLRCRGKVPARKNRGLWGEFSPLTTRKIKNI
jgi:hypothetical protein